MNILVAIKRVPAPGARITLTDDRQHIDTRQLGFTISPHEECAVEEAVQQAEKLGGETTVVTLGPVIAEEQLRTAISMGIDHGVLVVSEALDDRREPHTQEWDAQATAAALTDAVRTLEAERGPFDLILFGNESADAGNHQVAIRVAHALDRPVVAGVNNLDLADETVTLHRAVDGGSEVVRAMLPAVAAVKEGLNLPRYPALRGRLAAKKAQIRQLVPQRREMKITRRSLRHPQQEIPETRILGHGAAAAPAVVEILEQVGAL